MQRVSKMSKFQALSPNLPNLQQRFLKEIGDSFISPLLSAIHLANVNYFAFVINRIDNSISSHSNSINILHQLLRKRGSWILLQS